MQKRPDKSGRFSCSMVGIRAAVQTAAIGSAIHRRRDRPNAGARSPCDLHATNPNRNALIGLVLCPRAMIGNDRPADCNGCKACCNNTRFSLKWAATLLAPQCR